MVMSLVREFAQKVQSLDLLVIRASGPHFRDIPDNVNIISLKAKHTLTAIPEIVKYLKNSQPDAMLVAKDRAGRAALRARSLAGVDTRICIRLGTNLSTALKHKNRFQAWLRTAPMKRLYEKADAVIAVSEGVRQDTLAITKISPEKVHVIRNPVITDSFFSAAAEPVPHPWLEENQPSVIMGIGRLSVQKDFKTLIKAFHIVKQQRDVRLIILGDGSLRKDLELLIENLGLQDSVLMPGFQANPGAWLSRASVFVLSSRWEGSPNALSEALALGVPSVSTRCPSGPNEALEEGKYGPLIKMGDYEDMAVQIMSTLDQPLPSATLQEAVKEYHSPISAERYLALLLGK